MENKYIKYILIVIVLSGLIFLYFKYVNNKDDENITDEDYGFLVEDLEKNKISYNGDPCKNRSETDIYGDLFGEEKVTREEIKQELLNICQQENIPSKCIKECLYLELENCKEDSGKEIKKEDLERCAPIVIKEMIENLEERVDDIYYEIN